MITLCRGKYQTLKACLILKEDIITQSSLEAHSKLCFLAYFVVVVQVDVIDYITKVMVMSLSPEYFRCLCERAV